MTRTHLDQTITNGARVLGLSCITNPAAGLSAEPLRHEDVERRAKASAAELSQLVRALVSRIGSMPT